MVIGDFQMNQCHLKLKVSLKSSTRDHIWSQKEGVWSKTVLLGHFMFHFTTFIMFLYIRGITTKVRYLHHLTLVITGETAYTIWQ